MSIPKRRVGRPANTEGMNCKCTHCGYEWKTQSKGFYAICPRCHAQIRIKDLIPTKGKTVVVLNVAVSPESMDWLDEMIKKEEFPTRSEGTDKSIKFTKKHHKKGESY